MIFNIYLISASSPPLNHTHSTFRENFSRTKSCWAPPSSQLACYVHTDKTSPFKYYFFCFKMYKYQCKLLICINLDVMPPSGLVLLENMTSTQRGPGKGWVLLLLLASFSQAEEPVCRLIGDPENPQLSKDGDILLGGIFSFHNKWKNRLETYMQKPLPLQCTR